MKLFTRYNRINILASVLIFVCGCIAFYFVLNYILTRQLDEILETERSEIVQYAAQYNKLPAIINTNDKQVYFKEVATPVAHDVYSSQKIWNAHERENELMRTLLFGVAVKDKYVEVTALASQESQEELLQLILVVASVMIACILLAGYIINRIVLKKLWKPFYSSIDEISRFNLHKQQLLQLPPTGVEEFDLLNKSLGNMTEKAAADYKILKEFTGNAAHEMQTPLAVISANTESLIQDETILQQHYQSIFSIEDAVKRLSRLNQSLLLLTKIENRRFELNENVDWQALVKERLHELQYLVESKALAVQINAAAVSTVFHRHLADILITNLLSNAIRYNFEGGSIDVRLDATGLAISNTSALPALDPVKIFSRFYRHPETKPDGNGLGLPIVEQICRLAGYAVKYEYAGNKHSFMIGF
jgi:signal transduction histidine kinase